MAFISAQILDISFDDIAREAVVTIKVSDDEKYITGEDIFDVIYSSTYFTGLSTDEEVVAEIERLVEDEVYNDYFPPVEEKTLPPVFKQLVSNKIISKLPSKNKGV